MTVLRYIVDHPILTTFLATVFVAVLVPAALWLGTRGQQHRPRHRSTERAVVVPGHTPRHTASARTHEMAGAAR